MSKQELGYNVITMTAGRLTLASVPGFHIEVEWLFAETQPDELTTALELI